MKLIDLEFLTELSSEEFALQAVAGGCDPYSTSYGSNPSDYSSYQPALEHTTPAVTIANYLNTVDPFSSLLP